MNLILQSPAGFRRKLPLLNSIVTVGRLRRNDVFLDVNGFPPEAFLLRISESGFIVETSHPEIFPELDLSIVFDFKTPISFLGYSLTFDGLADPIEPMSLSEMPLGISRHPEKNVSNDFLASPESKEKPEPEPETPIPPAQLSPEAILRVRILDAKMRCARDGFWSAWIPDDSRSRTMYFCRNAESLSFDDQTQDCVIISKRKHGMFLSLAEGRAHVAGEECGFSPKELFDGVTISVGEFSGTFVTP